MANISPFRGWRYQTNLAKLLCPPYDIVSPKAAALLRRQPHNAAHLEIPAGTGAQRFHNAAKLWKKWTAQGILRQDQQPSFYISEERFTFNGRPRKRTGFLAALDVRDPHIIQHERTLPKPKAERLSLLRKLRVNTSPIFGVFPDPDSRIRQILKRITKTPPSASTGKIRIWRVHDPKTIQALTKAVQNRDLLIADGHHRYNVSRLAGARTVLAYLCPEQDPGLIVLPTHRIVARRGLAKQAQKLCRITACKSAAQLLRRLQSSRNPYAFGLKDQGLWLAEPNSARGCRSGLSVEWVERNLLQDAAREEITYTPDARAALATPSAIIIKPLTVSAVRLAARRCGLLPPKTTYFFPKVFAGLVFKQL